MKRSLASKLFRVARDVDTAEAVASGDPERIEHRAENIVIGRAAGRLGLWRRMWRH